jgi:hypothetical protein
MTRTLLAGLFVFLFTTFASAQINKGFILLGGQLSYSNNDYKTNDQHLSYGIFIISAGKAISENTVVGINLTYNPAWVDNYFNYGVGPLKYKNAGYGIGIFYRRYKALGKDFYLFVEAGAGYLGATQSGKNDAGDELLTGHSNGGNIYLTPGITYKISKKFFLELTIPNIFYAQYLSNKTDVQQTPPYKDKSNLFSISTSLSSNPLNSLAIGFRLNL